MKRDLVFVVVFAFAVGLITGLSVNPSASVKGQSATWDENKFTNWVLINYPDPSDPSKRRTETLRLIHAHDHKSGAIVRPGVTQQPEEGPPLTPKTTLIDVDSNRYVVVKD